jgi:hypothetical protein
VSPRLRDGRGGKSRTFGDDATGAAGGAPLCRRTHGPAAGRTLSVSDEDEPSEPRGRVRVVSGCLRGRCRRGRPLCGQDQFRPSVRTNVPWTGRVFTSDRTYVLIACMLHTSSPAGSSRRLGCRSGAIGQVPSLPWPDRNDHRRHPARGATSRPAVSRANPGQGQG